MKWLKELVWEQNLLLVKYGLVLFTWGNVSGFDKASGTVAIKPSGVEYDKLEPKDIVLIDLETGTQKEVGLRPSSDLQTHLEIYRAFKGGVGGVVHTHSTYATAFAQAQLPLDPYGTTHADYFHGTVPVTRDMTDEEIKGEYEVNTGKVIVETFMDLNPLQTPGVLVSQHGPFTWGKDAAEAVHNAAVLEEIARMAFLSRTLNPEIKKLGQCQAEKHFMRKHGPKAYYGQI